MHIASFKRESFEVPVLRDLENLELKDRAQLIADQMHIALPNDQKKRAQILNAMLHPEEDESPSDQRGIRGWGILPLSMVVGQHGIDDFEGSLDLLKEMTKRFSSEFGIRYFLLADQDRTLRILRGWLNEIPVTTFAAWSQRAHAPACRGPCNCRN